MEKEASVTGKYATSDPLNKWEFINR